jgi:uncharacterized membrane protein
LGYNWVVTSQSRPPTPALLRLGVGAVAGMLAAVVSVGLKLGYIAAQIGWDVAALTYIGLTVPAVLWLDPHQTARKATHEDATRAVADLLLLGAAVVSLASVLLIVVKAGNSAGAGKVMLTFLSVGSVIVSWALVHVTYMLRYARIYYSEPVGGADFHDDGRPSYADFAYLSFTVGMTFQVSDTELTSRAMRRAVLRHALLSYLFGTVILATTINLIAGLAR